MASKVIRKIISTANAARPAGPYSQAVVANNTIFVAGQVGLDKSGKLVDGGFEAELTQALENLKHILEAGGSGLDNVVKTTFLVQDINDLPKVNGIFTQYFKAKPPARTSFQVAALPLGAKVEVEAFAVTGEIEEQ